MYFGEIKTTQRGTRLEQFILVPASIATGTATQTTTGVIEGTYRCKVSKTSTGIYALTYNKPFLRKPVVQVSALHATSKIFAGIVSSSTSALVVYCYTTDGGTATDPTEFHITCLGFEAADQA